MNKPSKTHRLLEKWIKSAPRRNEIILETLAESEIERATLEQELAIKIAKPETGITSLPTFDPSRSRELSPMMKERMEYAGTISNDLEKWLGVKDMQKSISSKTIADVFNSLKENWENSAPARLHPSQIGLFGFSPDNEEDLTLLVWEENLSCEPKIVRYNGHNERVFKNLDAFLQWAAK